MYAVRELPRAQNDIAGIFAWLKKRSPQGAATWIDAYDACVAEIANSPTQFPLADENPVGGIEIRQSLFRTALGNRYRVVFCVRNDIVYILRVRGPGQPPLSDDEIGMLPLN